MTEVDWLADGTHPDRMLTQLRWGDVGITARQLRLFALAVSRWLGPGPESERIEEAWANAEQMAEHDIHQTTGEGFWVENRDPWKAAEHAARDLSLNQMPYIAAFLREIVGNIFRPVVLPEVYTGPPSHYPQAQSEFTDHDLRRRGWLTCPWLTWNDGAVPSMAKRIYEERAFDRLPILGDALEEAGCDNADILAHCRGQDRCPRCLGRKGQWHVVSLQPLDHFFAKCPACDGTGWIPLRVQHCLGCWVLDLLTGRH